MSPIDSDKSPAELLAELQDARRQVAEFRRSLETHQTRLKNAENYRLLVEEGPDPMFGLSPDGHYLIVNQALAEAFGKPVEAILGKTLWDFFPKEDADRRFASLSQVLRTGKEATIEGRVPRADGERYYQTTIKPIKDPSGKVLSAICTSRDITERRRVDEALRRSEQDFREAQHLAHIGSWRWTVATDTVNWSEELFHINGRNSELGAPSFAQMSSCYTPDSWNQLKSVVGRALETGAPYELDLDMVRPDGAIRHTAARGEIDRDASGKIVGLHGTVQDITDHKRAEAEQERLEAANLQLQKSVSLGRMAGAIAHHFNNQLQAVSGNLELALGTLSEHSEVRELLIDASRAARRASEVSSLMLTYLGHTLGQREPVDLSELCRRNLPLLAAAMPKNVVLDFDLPSPGPIINANANQLQQVLTNLLTNAWEADGRGPNTIRVTVRTGVPTEFPSLQCFPVDGRTRNDTCGCLEVADSGCGIAAEDIDTLFDPFFSRKFVGRGMGLPVILGIARAHQGAITVESELGKGSIFRVYVPLIAAQVSRPSDNAAEALDPQGDGTVLVVEDEAMIRKLAVTMLTRLGFTVLAARDGVEALEVFRQHSAEIRCVLCDLTMPRMNGWETLTALRELSPNLPVILASGYSDAQVMEGAHPERPQVYLSKPYRTAQLTAAIREALAGKPP